MKRYRRYAIPALLTVTILATLSFLIYGVVGATSAPAPRSAIAGEMIPALAGKTPLGATNTQQVLSLTVSLKLADAAGLQGLIKAQNDRHSPLYHQYITPQQFDAHYAPTQASVDAVTSYLSSQGLTVQSVSANRLSIKVRGTVGAIEHAFNMSISNFSLNGHVVFAPSSAPSVPSSLGGLISNIGGLDNTSEPQRFSEPVPSPKAGSCFEGTGLFCSGLAPADLRTAYDMNSLISSDDGTGQTVAIVELDGFISNDIAVYLNQYNLGAPKYSEVLLDGATQTPTAAGGALEVELDMEVMSAIAPGANQVIYIAPNGLANFQGFLDDFNQIVMDDTAKVVSNSWGLCEDDTGASSMTAFDTVFQEGVAQGQAFFSASGDAGAYDCNQDSTLNTSLKVDFPASDPNVVGVGGTSVTINSNSTYKSEVAWSCTIASNAFCAIGAKGDGGGGGLSDQFAQPSYQTGPGVNNSFSNGMREVPDVSANASQATPYSEYCTDTSIFGCDGLGWIPVFGTSAAAPLWAGVATDINEYLISQSRPTLGSASFALYWLANTAHPYKPYHDITSGNNLFYPATSGYDLATGNGSPDVWNIARDFAAAAPSVSPTPIYLATTNGQDPPAQTLTITNSGYAPYHWNLTLPPGVTTSSLSGTTAPNSSTPITLNFTLGNTPQSFVGTITVSDQAAIIPTLSVPVTVVEANVSKTWYFAEGYTGGSFSEYLTLANPNSVQANVQVEYLLGSGSPITKTYHVAANARATIFVNGEIGGGKNVSMVVTSDQPIVAERPMYFDFTGLSGLKIPGGTDVLGATSLNTSFDFGYLDTTANHATYLTILNQNSSDMTVSIDYFPAAGGSPLTRTHTVSANSRGTVWVNTDVPAGTYSALVTLSEPGLVERPLYLVDSQTHQTGAADVVGVSTPLTTWNFAEGYTSSTFNERYILSNPSTVNTANVTVTFFRSDGSTATQKETLTPGQQVVVSANSVLGSNNVNNSAQVTSDQPILAERFISFRYVGPAGPKGANVSIPGASDVLGASAPGNLFYFAEGYSGATFGEYLTIENPDPTNTATVKVTFLPSNGGTPVVKFYTIGHSSRFTLFTNSVMPNTSFSMVVESNVNIVAERPMYFIYNGGPTGGSDVIGYEPFFILV